jgi:hypothetical protein
MSKLGAIPAVLAGVITILHFPVVAQAQNLLNNGSFETPALGDLPLAGCTLGPAGNWFYCQSSSVPGWTVVKVVGGSYNLEFQTQPTISVMPTDGDQYAELATHPDSDSRVRISQSVSGLCPLEEYKLTYDGRKRESNDRLEVSYDGTTVEKGIVAGAWTSFTEGPFYPSTGTITVSFAEIGPEGTLGSLIDNISLTRVSDESLSLCDVGLDAKPGSNPNGVNLCKTGGVVPVAFVGSAGFDPNDYTIIGVSLVTDPDAGDFLAGKGRADVCHIEDVVDGTNPAEITPDGYDDVVCQIPTSDLSTYVDTTGETPAVAKVCLTLDDGIEPFTICREDELKLARTCE